MSKCASILVGVDFSAQSAVALREALWLAQRTRMRVCPVHVVDTLFPSPSHERLGELAKVVRGEQIQRARAEWNRFTLLAPEGKPLQLAVEIDSLNAAFARRVRSESARVIVIGLAGMPGERLKPEALETACLQDNTAPVLLVHPGRSHSSGRIAVCIDFSNASRTALRHALRLAAIYRASLQVLYLCSSAGGSKRGLATRLDEFCGPVLRGISGATVVHEIIDHPVPEAGLAEHLNRYAIDLTVLNLRDCWSSRYLLLESRLERLVQILPTSILVVGGEHQTLLPESAWPSEKPVAYGLTA